MSLAEIAPGVRRLRAPNPSPMTKDGTNTYLVGQRALAVIDPGPDDAGHLAAILAAIGAAPVSHVLVTHAHRDHSSLARPLADAVGAPLCGFGPPEAGRSETMAALAAEGLSGGEGVDRGFRPDLRLAEGDRVAGDGWRLDVLWTPGHFSGHLCFALGDILFTGDHVMGWASSLVSPPDGDLTAFMASCERLALRTDRLYLPGHGEPVTDPADRIAWLIAHRRQREAQILDALRHAPATYPALTRRIYRDTPPALLPAAERNVLAHLIDLVGRGLAAPGGALGRDTEFTSNSP